MQALRIGSFLLCALGWLYPRPYELVLTLLAGLPLLGLVLQHRFGALLETTGAGNTSQNQLDSVLLFPCFVLAYRAFDDACPIDPTGFLPAFFVLLGIFLLLTWKIRFVHLPYKIFTWIFWFAYAYGFSTLGNELLDRSEAIEEHAVTVLVRRISTNRTPLHSLYVTPWDALSEEHRRDPGFKLDVSSELYETTQLGDKLCVRVHSGAFGSPWWSTSARCDE